MNLTACAENISVADTRQDRINALIQDTVTQQADPSENCQLMLNGTTVLLDIPWPYHIHRNEAEEIQVHALDDKSILLLVEHSVPHPELSNDCVTQMQAVRVEQQTVLASAFTSTVAACLPFQWDEKIFTGLFSDNPG